MVIRDQKLISWKTLTLVELHNFRFVLAIVFYSIVFLVMGVNSIFCDETRLAFYVMFSAGAISDHHENPFVLFPTSLQTQSMNPISDMTTTST